MIYCLHHVGDSSEYWKITCVKPWRKQCVCVCVDTALLNTRLFFSRSWKTLAVFRRHRLSPLTIYASMAGYVMVWCGICSCFLTNIGISILMLVQTPNLTRTFRGAVALMNVLWVYSPWDVSVTWRLLPRKYVYDSKYCTLKTDLSPFANTANTILFPKSIIVKSEAIMF